MVFPNFNWINSNGKKFYLNSLIKNKPKYFLNDQPAHGACSLIDLKFLKQLGGYCEKFDRQDGFIFGSRFYLRNMK